MHLMLKRHELAALWPSDPRMCQRVFDRLSVERGFERASPEARDLAMIVLFLFQDGHTEEADLLGAASGTFYFATPLKAARIMLWPGGEIDGRVGNWRGPKSQNPRSYARQI
ncbi:hypothetical protein AJ88_45745 [Mesorhizobium amorphae CCBAU 01583]|nr:hypothetical protein AJ88_45745 [Mesorhizobium amorphae CCBAU 01583]